MRITIRAIGAIGRASSGTRCGAFTQHPPVLPPGDHQRHSAHMGGRGVPFRALEVTLKYWLGAYKIKSIIVKLHRANYVGQIWPITNVTLCLRLFGLRTNN